VRKKEMEQVNWNFSDKFRGHWIKVKFYKDRPELKGVERLKGVRFCKAIREVILHPVLLGKEDVSCSGAQYAFG